MPRLVHDLQEHAPQVFNGKNKEEFRNYVDSGHRQSRVEKFYAEQHTYQTFDFVRQKEVEFSGMDKMQMGVWEALELLDSLVDESDPDTDASQLQHALQTAEAIRLQYPGEEHGWYQVTGLIHDLGKILAMKWGEPQWCVVGDTFPVGCAFSETNVFGSRSFVHNPDSQDPVYSTLHGVYTPHCGLAKVHMSWGHDEYLFRICKSQSTLPPPALAMIRFHSFYPWHKEGGYDHLLNDEDREMLVWVRDFNRFDLYSKSKPLQNVEELKTYYKEQILKFFPPVINW
jgi:inositol oxygenase